MSLGLPAEKDCGSQFIREDDEAADIWLKDIGRRFRALQRAWATSDNFWSMGDTGPCGPCSEIFYDHGAEIEGGPPGSRRKKTAIAISRSGTWSSCSSTARFTAVK